MRKPQTPRREEVPSPDRAVEVPDPLSRYEPSHVVQLLVELQREVLPFGAKLDRAVADLSELRKEVQDLQGSYMWVKGFAAAAVVLIPVCAAIVWWLVGDQIGDLKSQLMRSPPAQIQQGPKQPG